MKSIFEQVIARGNYDLTGLLRRIDAYHIEGKLTDEDRAELYAQARKRPIPQYDAGAEIEALWKCVRALQDAVAALSQQPEVPPEELWPEFVQPTGAHDAYHEGDQVTHNGKRYVCRIDNCVWAPDVYPAGWLEQLASEEINS